MKAQDVVLLLINLTVYVQIHHVHAQASSGECCSSQSNCRNVSTINTNVNQLADDSPFYEIIQSTDDLSVLYESVCTTYFRVSEILLMEFRSILFINKSSIVSVHLVSDLSPGVFRVQGLFQDDIGNSTTIQNQYIVGMTCNSCQPTYMYYKCFLFDTCDDVISDFDVVNGRSTSTELSSTCLDTFESLAAAEGFNVRGFTRLPGRTYSCVAYYGNNTCVNYERMPVAYRMTYPPPEATTMPTC